MTTDESMVVLFSSVTFVVCYFYIRWKYHQNVLRSLVMTCITTIFAIPVFLFVYADIVYVVCHLGKLFKQHKVISAIVLLNCTIVIADIVLYIVRKIRRQRRERIRQKLANLLDSEKRN